MRSLNYWNLWKRDSWRGTFEK